MTKAELSYASGFIDADGCVLIARTKEKRMKHGLRHVPRLCAAGIDKRPLKFLFGLFGGHIMPQRRKKPDPRMKRTRPVWQWKVDGTRAIHVARKLMPYLRVKSVQAYLLSCFEYEAQWSKGGKPENAVMPDAEFERREKICAELRHFNAHESIPTV